MYFFAWFTNRMILYRESCLSSYSALFIPFWLCWFESRTRNQWFYAWMILTIEKAAWALILCPETRHCYKPSRWLQIQKYSAILSGSILGNKPQMLWWWTAGGNILHHSYWINSLTSKRVRLTGLGAGLRQLRANSNVKG